MLSLNRVKHSLMIIVGLANFAGLASTMGYAAQSSIPVSYGLSYHFEASDGTQGPSESLNLVMMNPPRGLDQLELESELSPLAFAADCTTQQVRIHDRDGAMDSDWSPTNHGEFEVSLNSPSIRIVNDGVGHSNCMAEMVLHVRGKLDCRNPSAPGLSADIAYQFSGELQMMGMRGAAKMCSLPQGSYLYGRI